VADDGVERLRRWREEDRGVPRAVGRLGAILTSVAPRSTTVRIALTPELLLPDGSPTGAVSSLVADIGLTTSVISSLPDLGGVTTISMTVDHLHEPPVTGALSSQCTAGAYDGGRPQHAVGTLHDDAGRLVAVASGWFLAVPAGDRADEQVGLAVEPPAQHLLDLLRVPAGPEFDLVARDALSNAIGSMYGGIGALAGQLAASAALHPGATPLTSTVTYLHPTPRGSSVRVTGSAVRQGRRTSVACSTLRSPDGRTLVTSTLVAAAR